MTTVETERPEPNRCVGSIRQPTSVLFSHDSQAWSPGGSVSSPASGPPVEGAVHVTIPTSYRINRAGGERYEVHRGDLTETEVMRIDAVVLTMIPRTLADSIGHAPDHLVRQVIDTAVGRGAITQAERSQLAATAGAST